jgi:tetratricopeptide (TPR) repeat protein
MSQRLLLSVSPVFVGLAAAFLFFSAGTSKEEEIQRHRNLGKALFENPISVAQAPEEFKKALELAPNSDRDRLNYGITLLKAGHVPEGMAELMKVQKTSPQLPHSWFNLGIEYIREGETEKAIEQLSQLVKLAPQEPVAHHNLGVAFKSAGRLDEARREFEAAAQLKPGFAAPHFQLYNLHRQADRKDDAKRELQAFLAAKKAQEGAVSTEDAEWCDYAEIYDPLDGTRSPKPVPHKYSSKKLTVNADPATAGITLLDLAGNGSTDAVVWSKLGITILRQGTEEVKNTGLESVTGVVAVAPGDFDNDGLPDLCVITKDEAALYQNRKGTFAKVKSFPGQFDNAVWLDYDRDYDLDLFLFGRASKLYRNDGPAGWEDRTADFPFAEGRALRGEVFRMIPDTKSLDLRVDYEGGKTLIYRDQLGGKYVATPGTPRTVKPPGVGLPLAAFAEADFDGDGRVDVLAVAKGGGAYFFHNETAKRSYLRIQLAGVKNAKLAPATEVEIKAGLIYEKQMYNGVPLVFDLEDKPEADMVRITWANGLMQSEKSQAANRLARYEESQRLSGSCPMIWTWNGVGFEFITDVLGVAPLGAAAGDGTYFPVDHTEYISIPSDALALQGGKYELRITEELAEVSYLDQVQLIAVDHPASVDIYSNEKFQAPPFPDLKLYGVEKRIAPVSARDQHGRDVLDLVLHRDGRYPDSFKRTRGGTAEPWHLDLDFGKAAPDNKAILVLNGWVDWADGSTFLQASQESKTGLMTPSLQVKDAQGRWRTVIEDMGMPAGKPKTIVVDLTGKFLSKSREVRIVTNLCVYWDEIFLSENPEAPRTRLTNVPMASADLHFRGFSRVSIHPERKQPERFFYDHARAESMWNPTPGLYTRYGEVRPLLTDVDDRLVLMGSGDEARLQFDARSLPLLPQGWRRDFLLKVDGWAKDRDANTAFSQTVGPLPFHGMSGYPYKPTEKFPDDEAHRAYQREWNTRPARQILQPLAGNR